LPLCGTICVIEGFFLIPIKGAKLKWPPSDYEQNGVVRRRSLAAPTQRYPWIWCAGAGLMPNSSSSGLTLRHRRNTLSSFGRYNFGGAIRKPKELRKAYRRKVGLKAWIRLDGGFAVRPCSVADLSDTGVQIAIPATEAVPGIFTLLMSRNASSGRRARVKWRRGSNIGAEFL
jgi:hypothetical protein